MNASLLSSLRAPTALRAVAAADRADRSAVNTALSAPDVLDDEDARHAYFFSSGADAWCEDLGDYTFSSTFCTLTPAEAQVIVAHWEDREREIARLVREQDAELTSECGGHTHPNLAVLLAAALARLAPLRARIGGAIAAEVAKSSAGRAFVKLSTRSPKDSKKALVRAKRAYEARLQALAPPLAGSEIAPANERWKILCDEVTKAGSVANADEAMELLLDSARVYEDLEYALRGPSVLSGAEQQGESEGGGEARGEKKEHEAVWRTCLCTRAWDPRLPPQSEFRGIVWGGKLTCLCQYFHPLWFPELAPLRDTILADVQATFASAKASAAIARLGGHCIVDFAWLGPGQQTIIIELNPFDGVCLGTFPASTGLFLWDKPSDRKIMKGEAEFEFRLRDAPLDEAALKNQCNSDWRDIVYP